MTTIPRFSTAVFVAIAFTGIGHASQKMRYEEIPVHIAPFGALLEHHRFKVITLDGKEHGAGKLLLESDHARLSQRNDSFENIPAEQIARIEISNGWRYSKRIGDSAALPVVAAFPCIALDAVAGSLCAVGVIALFSPVWAFTAVTAPFYLATDAIAFLLPPKVYEIVH